MKKILFLLTILFTIIVVTLTHTTVQQAADTSTTEELPAQSISSFTPNVKKENTLTIIAESVDDEWKKDSNPFWLNSGAFFYTQGKSAQTIQGDLPPYSYWRLVYAATNPDDTDNGYHPQNIFRLITKAVYENNIQQVYARITKDNLSTSENRNLSNGIFLINRYQDANNLYYAGIRVDGTAIIKEKISGVYHTLAQQTIFPGDTYDKNLNPNLLPKHIWLGLKTEIQTVDSKTVRITLYTDTKNLGIWEKTLTATDTPEKGANPLINSGSGGIRTDFMDVEFKNYLISATSTP